MKIKSLFLGKGPVQRAVKDAEALERAASMARQENDYEHANMLEKAALFKRRVARERAAGFTGWPVCAFDKVV